jgi:hypothetical protein
MSNCGILKQRTPDTYLTHFFFNLFFPDVFHLKLFTVPHGREVRLQLPSYDSLEELSAKLREAMDNAGDLWGPPWAFFWGWSTEEDDANMIQHANAKFRGVQSSIVRSIKMYCEYCWQIIVIIVNI